MSGRGAISSSSGGPDSASESGWAADMTDENALSHNERLRIEALDLAVKAAIPIGGVVEPAEDTVERAKTFALYIYGNAGINRGRPTTI